MNILITGASRGIGRELVEQYLERYPQSRVIAVSTNADRLLDLREKYKSRIIVAPISVSSEVSRTEIKTLFESSELKGQALDLLINNAGAYPKEPEDFEKISIDYLQEGFEANTYTVFRTTQACLPYLKKSKYAKVVSVSSLMGSISDNTSGGSYAYRMAKAAINMFNKCFAVEYAEITAVVLHPGWVQTEMGGKSAPTTIQESVSGMIKVIADLSVKDSGKFFDFEGDSIEW